MIPDDFPTSAADLTVSTAASKSASEYINLKDEETIKGVQALEYVGILGKDRAQEILETPVTDQERYTAQG